jgi:hypothetical protein
MEDNQWWPERKDWPELPAEEWITPDGKVTSHRFDTEQAMALLLLNEHVIMLNAGGTCGLFVNCSDIFFYASADAEPIPPIGFGKDDIFWELYDLVREHDYLGATKWCSLRRGILPLKKYQDRMVEAGLWCDKLEAIKVKKENKAQGNGD